MTPRLHVVAAAEFRQGAMRRRETLGGELDPGAAARLEELFGEPVSAVEAVRRIVEDVRERGDEAVREWTSRLDGAEVGDTLVPADSLAEAWEATPPALRIALEAAAERIRDVHRPQRDTTVRGTADVHIRPEPLRRVGCYVPGGRAAYPSTVLMNVIPAQLAGVGSIVVASPPAPSGLVHPHVLAAAHLLGVTEVRAIGGAQAIAALAVGTASLPRVDKVVGPGNLFVTLAKHAVFGACGIDQLAGPSEILVIASAGADPAHVAHDLVSQLEHDPLAWAVVLSNDAALLEAISTVFATVAGEATRADVIALSAGRHAAAVRCADLDECLSLAADFAPEHLSLQGDAAEACVDSVRAAGAIFCGTHSPVSLGDYAAGSNHTLPTQGAARHRGGLSVLDFLRWPSVVRLSPQTYARLAPIAQALAEAEGLPGHAAALRARQLSSPVGETA